LIQYAVDEARAAGIEQLVFITGRGKAALDDYFDIGFELETTMRERGKTFDALEPSRSGFGEVVSVRQQQPLGLGHAVWCAGMSSATSRSRCCCPTT
jgi:UTP--glucose-1-phosphate uridylyltransferase